MNFLSNPVAARLLWALPLLLLVIAVATFRAGMEQRAVDADGQTVQAEVVGLNLRERSEITAGQVDLRYTPPGAAAPVERRVELPIILLKEIEADQLDVPEGEAMRIPIVVSPETDQIVLGNHRRGTWLLTLSLSGMALIGTVVSGLLVGGWNRLLAREGDPALRDPALTP
ncbi:hypothetical protein RQM47_08195 [Rubrivirga sp. S365]|uniref:DUF3592 domain-containing protein n=1 Tax=Rubrivirga litoralis TaxID=3075598 RepID=A0ABU3BPN0_9BACT|nr:MULTISPECIES: hypothetical protein [unclassified Rubrivirga]MDT0631239.1 hypothetical protein [Rubrivirga sp. F394]MDT7856618.1 hypothetical protein [Rubrivirga sp. S365]